MRRMWATFVLQLVIAPVLVAGGGTVFNKPQVRVTFSFVNFDARIMDHWGGGGGSRRNISEGSRYPFVNRTFGGARRYEIRGTRAFGSGYPYGTGNSSTIAGRPFPFGVWPLYWDQKFMDSDEYGPQYDTIRPGGFVASVPLRTSREHFNITDGEVYYAIGDRESLLPLIVSYVDLCHVSPAWPSRFGPSLPNATIKLENVIQYFRASSFGLASPEYNNTFARISNSNSTESTPLPEFMQYSPFRQCLDTVTETALAIMNKFPSYSPEETFIGVLRGYGVFIFPAILFVLYLTYQYLLELRWRLHEWWYWRSHVPWEVRQEREQELQYENYP